MRPEDNIVEWVRHHLTGAVEWAEKDIAAQAEARKRNVQVMLDRGSCFVGHDGFTDPSCGYCASARLARDVKEDDDAERS